MKFRKRYKNNSKVNILLPLVFLFIVFLSVGYSSLNQELNITSEAVFRVEESIRITDIKLVGSAFNGIENYNSSYSKDRIKMGITLNEVNSSITYQVTITNTGNVPMNLSSLDNINYSNDGITYELNEKLPYMINKGEEKKIEITYKWSSYNEESKNLDSVIKFNFIKAESVLAKGSSSSFVNNSSLDRSKVESIKFMPTIEVPSDAIEAWDASLNKDGSVMAYTLDNDSNDLYELYIAGYGEIKLSEASYLFQNFTSMVTLDFDNLVTTDNVTNMTSMFDGCSLLPSINLTNFDTTNVTNMFVMFRNCSSLISLDLSNFNMLNVIDTYAMFFDCPKLEELKMNNIYAPKLTRVGWFRNNTNLKKLYLKNFNAPLLKSYSSITAISTLEELDITGMNTENVTDMSNMFKGCSKLINIDLSSFDTSNVTNMSNMFNGCSRLASLDVSNMNTEKVTNMSYMFGSCSKITDVNVSGFDTSKVTDMTSMFDGCSLLPSINLTNFDTTNVTNMFVMFRNCSSLISLDLSNFNMLNVIDTYAMFFDCPKLEELKMNNIYAPKLTRVGWFRNNTNLKKLYLKNFNAPLLKSYSSITAISTLEELDITGMNTENVTDMSNMFKGCSKLINIDLSSFDTSNVTNMSNMFNGCSKLINIDLSSFDTSGVTNMNCMFYNCSSLEGTIDLSLFNVSNVTNMYAMFAECSKLTNLKLNNWNVEKLTNVDNMFLRCTSLKEIDFSLVNSETYEKDIFKSMINQVGNITFYVKDSECKTLMETIKPNATVEIKSA